MLRTKKSLGGWGDRIFDDGTGARSVTQAPFAYLVESVSQLNLCGHYLGPTRCSNFSNRGAFTTSVSRAVQILDFISYCNSCSHKLS